jgi:hypothetical protein
MKLGKREKYLTDLRQYTLVNNEIVSYLLAHSNLPGKRGNIELAFAFADYIEEQYHTNTEQVLTYCVTLISENPPHKHIIGNEEFLPFCGILGLGRIGKIDTTKEPDVLEFLKSSAQDGRWRIREAVAMAIQDLMDVRPEAIIEKLQAWIHEDSYLIHRAVAAGLAEPRFMRNREITRVALDMHKAILERVTREPAIRDTDYKVLVKGLCYTLSVIITGIEHEGFAYLEALIATDHPIIKKIVRENLKKKRLTRLNAKKVAELQHKLEGAV